ncbi:MAG: aminopeptidase [Anaerolineae bacterium]|nr:aminopeptidase [Anaerolineae bacterium]
MADPRHEKLAKVIINYSLGIKPGDKLQIAGADIAAPFILCLYREAIRAGAHVRVEVGIDGLTRIFYDEASEDQLKFQSELRMQETEYFDAFLSIWADHNTKSMTGIDPKKIALRQSSGSAAFKRFLERMQSKELRWTGTLFPVNANAQDAGMSLTDYENFVYGAGLLDHDDPIASWKKVQVDQQKIVDFLDQKKEIHIVAPDTDITYRTDGRTWVNCCGHENFPDGEVFTGPVENSVNGTVRFSYPAVYNNNEVVDVRLTFQDGKVVEASAAKGQDFLLAMLDMDAGSRTLGEAAFGMNYGVKEFTNNTLFDEKIGGTMHMALGQSLPDTGGVNQSGLHWDMVCDLREGKVYADGDLVYEGGKFII